MIITDTILHRFRGIRAVYGENAFRQFTAAHVFIAGVGGVGSWCAESLIRSGIGSITMLDCDTIEDSNSNRQLHTMQSSLGQLKAAVLAERFRDINPEARISVITTRLSAANITECVPLDADIYIDAIDDLPVKAALISYVHRDLGKTIIVSGGAGGKKNPGLMKTADLAASFNDALLSRLRSVLRREFGYPPAPASMGLTAVFSSEKGVSGQEASPEGSDIPPFGALMCVTASQGLMMGSEVLKQLAAAPGTARAPMASIPSGT